jgi:cytidyltransferase-like protein
MPSNAVYDGRFQPLHIGHVAVMKAIRKAFGDPLTVVIIGSLPTPSDGTAAHYSREVVSITPRLETRSHGSRGTPS